jgi:hypothetical protein
VDCPGLPERAAVPPHSAPDFDGCFARARRALSTLRSLAELIWDCMGISLAFETVHSFGSAVRQGA